ncbi:ATP-dependent dethiobiotin synthetase BioD [Deinococcus multiflagellatus]|uniref:ATP-dependent dethiobiotin synthetase BioD n=1 Tax=Deinococcus multiflagellatus TaxID=1656887 RepID=A0ABW1ZNP7_9DEIO
MEGAGGVLVPVNEQETMLDLMAAHGAPVIVAARSALGTINHTLLTVGALRARGLRVHGVVLIGPPPPTTGTPSSATAPCACWPTCPRWAR